MVTYNEDKLLIMHNTSAEEITVDLSTLNALKSEQFEKISDYVGMGKAKLKGTVLTLGAYTSVIIE